jgi:hypothetical protein
VTPGRNHAVRLWVLLFASSWGISAVLYVLGNYEAGLAAAVVFVGICIGWAMGGLRT